MTVTENDHSDRIVLPDSESQQPIVQAETPLPGSASYGCNLGDWDVTICLGVHLITRKAYPRKPLENPDLERDEVVWPVWPATPAEEASVAAMPLADLQKYLGITLFLVLQVMRPEAVSYEDVQNARP